MHEFFSEPFHTQPLLTTHFVVAPVFSNSATNAAKLKKKCIVLPPTDRAQFYNTQVQTNIVRDLLFGHAFNEEKTKK